MAEPKLDKDSPSLAPHGDILKVPGGDSHRPDHQREPGIGVPPKPGQPMPNPENPDLPATTPPDPDDPGQGQPIPPEMDTSKPMPDTDPLKREPPGGVSKVPHTQPVQPGDNSPRRFGISKESRNDQ